MQLLLDIESSKGTFLVNAIKFAQGIKLEATDVACRKNAQKRYHTKKEEREGFSYQSS
jgi:hypothetical protein